MKAGKLDRRIDIVSVGTSQDATGEPIASDGVLETVWAQKLEQRVSERFSGASDQPDSLVIFRIRRRVVDQSAVVVYPAASGDRYEITGIAEVDRDGLDLTCRRLGENV